MTDVRNRGCYSAGMPILPVLATFAVAFALLRLIVCWYDPPWDEADEYVMVLEPPYDQDAP